MTLPGILRFEPLYLEKVWGGQRLRARFNAGPEGRPVGEAWLIADHHSHASAVRGGACAGQTLHDLAVKAPEALLGRLSALTPHGRFPLLLKLLDASGDLSVQVHPGDAGAAALNEPDVGKTEMWHVIDAEAGAVLYCGIGPGTHAENFLERAASGAIAGDLHRLPARPGTAVFVPAGTVHAIGAGILLAEIQQNSDLTYRIHDWDRSGGPGARPLHLEKALRVTRFDGRALEAAQPLGYAAPGAAIQVLGACRYFAAEHIVAQGRHVRESRGDSFHIVLALTPGLEVAAAEARAALDAGEACLVPACAGSFTLAGAGEALHYYVADWARDIADPLRAAGHAEAAIQALRGDPPAA